MPSEFDIIRRYFNSPADLSKGVVVGGGDDAAILRPPAGHDLVTAVDTLVSGVHFPENTPAEAIGHRALAVNLSDLAAMGAKPAWALMALSLPAVDENWLTGFMAGFRRLADQADIVLVGGDTTRSPVLTVSVTVQGIVPTGTGLQRGGAKAGDLIYVSGVPGLAAAGLALLQNKLPQSVPETLQHALKERFYYPQPRLALGRYLLDKASAAIDISDGLAADLGHILSASNVGAQLALSRLPQLPEISALIGARQMQHYSLGGGDDYELCFTLPAAIAEQVGAQLAQEAICIGVIEAQAGLRVVDDDGTINDFSGTLAGFDHFNHG